MIRAPSRVDCSSEGLIEQLRDRMHQYEGLPNNSGELRLVKAIHRRFCRIYLLRVSSGGNQPELVVKVPVGHSDVAYQRQVMDAAFVDRPRLFSRANPANKPRHEYAALCRIQKHFEAKRDSRFHAVKVYDLLPDQEAIVMQWMDQPSMRSKLYASHRFSRQTCTSKLEEAFSHAGAWLHEHHRLAPLDHCESRNGTAEDYLSAIERFVRFLHDHLSHQDELCRIHERIIAEAGDHLPTIIPTGQVHGDFAPRNVLIDDSNRVCVFDTLGRFEAPVYEDIAKMLMTIRVSGPQMITGGTLFNRERLQRFERAFLEGYFGSSTIPWKRIELFLAQLLLEHWAAVVYQHKHQRGVKRIAKSIRRSLWQSGFLNYLREIFETRNDLGAKR